MNTKDLKEKAMQEQRHAQVAIVKAEQDKLTAQMVLAHAQGILDALATLEADDQASPSVDEQVETGGQDITPKEGD